MNVRSDLGGAMSDWFDEQAGRGAPAYLDEVLERTIRTRQRPAWSSLERWLPVQSTLRFAPVPRVAWLAVALVALVVAFAIAALAVGSRQQRVPPPFGPARNGAIVFGGTDSDIHQLDAISGATTTLVTGLSRDRAPSMSPDGTRFFFLRDTPTTDPMLKDPGPVVMIANGDGSGVRSLTGRLTGFHGTPWDGRAVWSGDGSRVAVALAVGGRPAIEIFTVDGSATPVIADTNGNDAEFLAFRPDGKEITFLGSTTDANGLYAVKVDGSGIRTIRAPADADYASLSPDGTKLAYQAAGGTRWAYRVLHVVDVDTGIDTVPAFDPPVVGSGQADDAPAWSPDGTTLLFQRYIGGEYRMAVAPVAGGPVIQMGPQMPQHNGERVEAQFSPDGSRLLVHYADGGATWLLDATGTSTDTELPSTIADAATWQRLALAP